MIINQIVTTVLLIFAMGAFYQSLATIIDEYRYPPLGQLVDIGGYKLHLNFSGKVSIEDTHLATKD